MSYFFLDTSAIVKRYFRENGTAWVERLVFPQSGNTVVLSEITLVETSAAIAARHRAPKGISLEERDTILKLFLEHCRDDYQLVPMSRQIVDRAITLPQRYRLRGYDAAQLATALILIPTFLANGLLAPTFVTADNDLLAAAKAEGLDVDNPNAHP